MGSTEHVRQFDDTHLHWVVSHKERRHEFDTEISEQRSDERACGNPPTAPRTLARHLSTDDLARLSQ